MHITEYERSQTKLQAAIEQMILDGKPNVFITLRPNVEDGVSFERMEKLFGIFAYKLKCKLFGRGSKKRIFMVPVVEKYAEGESFGALTKNSDGTHIHCLVHFPGDPIDYKEMVRGLWINSSNACGDPDIYCPDSEKWFTVLNTEESQRALAKYIVKTCTEDTQAVLWKFVPSGFMCRKG